MTRWKSDAAKRVATGRKSDYDCSMSLARATRNGRTARAHRAELSRNLEFTGNLEFTEEE